MQKSLLQSYRKLSLLGHIPIFILSVTSIWIAGWFIFGDSIPYIGYINASGIIFAMLLLAATFIALLRRRWITFILSLSLVIWLFYYASGTNFAAGENRVLNSDIRIMTASLRGLNRDMEDTAKHLSQYDANIIALQEVYDADRLKASLEKASGKTWYMLSEGKLTILAQYPVKPSRISVTGVLTANIVLPDRAISVWTLHAPKTYSQPLFNRQFFKNLASEITINAPDVVLGDFNASPWNEGYLRISKTMQDSHKVAGFGPGNTFPAAGRRSGIFGAFTRIDHIFMKKTINVVNSFRGKAYTNSDHHPVITDIRINKKSQ